MVFGALAALLMPNLAAADVPEGSFTDPAQFQSELQNIVTTGTGTGYLTYSGPAGQALIIDQTISAPGTNDSLQIDLGANELLIQDGITSINPGTQLNLGTTTGFSKIQLGSSGKTGELNISGGTVNLDNAYTGSNHIQVGYANGHTGILRITNGGQLNLGTDEGAKNYSGFFIGYSGGNGQLVMDNGSVVIGDQGASVRLGISADANLELRNGSIIDSSHAASHFRVGEGSGTATVTVDNSSIVIKGGGTNAGIDDRYFVIGYGGGNGTFTQEGDDSYVHLSGLALVGIGRGAGSYGEYNLNGGVLEVGREGIATEFQVGVGENANTSTAVFNVNGGEARLLGNLKIAFYQGSEGVLGSGTVNVNGGLVTVGGTIRFGQGNGTLNLNGGVLEAGGTIASTATSHLNFNGGTLRARTGSNLTVSHDATVGSDGAIFDSNGNTLTYSGLLSGTGGVVKVGEGKLVLSAANTYEGGTEIQAGVVEAVNANALGAGAATLNGGTLRLTENLTLSNDLVAGEAGGTVDVDGVAILAGDGAGTGNVTFTGGDVTLTGSLSWSGETIVATGATLAAGADSVMSDASVLRLQAGSTYNNQFNQSVAGLAGTGLIDLSTGNLTVGSNNSSSTFEGTISGNGTLIKAGTGRLNLAGNTGSTFSGLMTVSGGLLSINNDYGQANIEIGAGGTLGGNGTVGSIRSVFGQTGGVIAPGNSIGRLIVTDELDLGGLIYEAEIDGSDMDVLQVDGRAILSGGTLRVLAGASSFLPSTSYTFMTTGSVQGAFAEIIDDFAFLDAKVVVDRGQISLIMERNLAGFAEAANTANQTSVAEALITTDEDSALQLAILQLTEDEAPSAFDVLSGEIHASARTALIEDTRRIRTTANDRVRAGFAQDESQPGYNLWAHAFASGGSIAGNGNAAKLDRSSSGFLTGIDGQLEGWTLGGLVGYSHSSLHANARASSASADTFHVGVYGGNRWNGLGVRGGIAYAWSSVETNRAVALRGLTDSLSADHNAGAFHAFGEIGYEMNVGGATIEPFANLAHVRLHTDGFSETGGDASLSASSSTMDTTFVTVGLHAASDLDVAGYKIKARGTVGWQRALGDIDPVSNHRFQSGEAFSVTGTPIAKNTAVVEAGVDFAIAPETTLSLSYGGQFGSGVSEHGGRIGLNVKF